MHTGKRGTVAAQEVDDLLCEKLSGILAKRRSQRSEHTECVFIPTCARWIDTCHMADGGLRIELPISLTW